jgi:hypothetical protein
VPRAHPASELRQLLAKLVDPCTGAVLASDQTRLSRHAGDALLDTSVEVHQDPRDHVADARATCGLNVNDGLGSVDGRDGMAGREAGLWP